MNRIHQTLVICLATLFLGNGCGTDGDSAMPSGVITATWSNYCTAVFTQDHSVWSNGELDESSSPKVYFVLDGKYRSCVLMYLQEKRIEAQRRELAVW